MTLRGPARRLADGSERAGGQASDPAREHFEVLADLLVTPADGWLRVCRECGGPFVTLVESFSKWGSCCGPCLRWLG